MRELVNGAFGQPVVAHMMDVRRGCIRHGDFSFTRHAFGVETFPLWLFAANVGVARDIIQTEGQLPRQDVTGEAVAMIVNLLALDVRNSLMPEVHARRGRKLELDEAETEAVRVAIVLFCGLLEKVDF